MNANITTTRSPDVAAASTACGFGLACHQPSVSRANGLQTRLVSTARDLFEDDFTHWLRDPLRSAGPENP